MWEICSKSTIKTSARHHDAFIVNFKRFGVSIVDFEQVNVGWKIVRWKFSEKSKHKDSHFF